MVVEGIKLKSHQSPIAFSITAAVEWCPFASATCTGYKELASRAQSSLV